MVNIAGGIRNQNRCTVLCTIDNENIDTVASNPAANKAEANRLSHSQEDV